MTIRMKRRRAVRGTVGFEYLGMKAFGETR
jgi:hypothetical protein